MKNNIALLDKKVLLWVQDHVRTPGLTPIMREITFLGDVGWFSILLSAGLAIKKTTRGAAACVIGALSFGAFITNLVLKPSICKRRPINRVPKLTYLIPEPKDWSFPSGHTTAAFATAGVIAKRFNKRIGALAYTLASLVGFSRVYLGVHYPTDVIGGFIVGKFASTAVCNMYKKLGKR